MSESVKIASISIEVIKDLITKTAAKAARGSGNSSYQNLSEGDVIKVIGVTHKLKSDDPTIQWVELQLENGFKFSVSNLFAHEVDEELNRNPQTVDDKSITPDLVMDLINGKSVWTVEEVHEGLSYIPFGANYQTTFIKESDKRKAGERSNVRTYISFSSKKSNHAVTIHDTPVSVEF